MLLAGVRSAVVVELFDEVCAVRKTAQEPATFPVLISHGSTSGAPPAFFRKVREHMLALIRLRRWRSFPGPSNPGNGLLPYGRLPFVNFFTQPRNAASRWLGRLPPSGPFTYAT